jgi:hypothetical protein
MARARGRRMTSRPGPCHTYTLTLPSPAAVPGGVGDRVRAMWCPSKQALAWWGGQVSSSQARQQQGHRLQWSHVPRLPGRGMHVMAAVCGHCWWQWLCWRQLHVIGW